MAGDLTPDERDIVSALRSVPPATRIRLARYLLGVAHGVQLARRWHQQAR